MNALYDWFLEGLQRTADFVETRLMTGFTRDYIVWMLGFFLALLGVTAARGAVSAADRLAAAGLAGVGGAAVRGADGRRRAERTVFPLPGGAVISLGAVGTGLVIMWTLFRAPDLA